MIRLPAGRFLTRPLPPADFAARFFAAVIRPPRVFFILNLVEVVKSPEHWLDQGERRRFDCEMRAPAA